jgi:hypothetical protein
VIEPVDPFQGCQLDVVEPCQGLRRRVTWVL